MLKQGRWSVVLSTIRGLPEEEGALTCRAERLMGLAGREETLLLPGAYGPEGRDPPELEEEEEEERGTGRGHGRRTLSDRRTQALRLFLASWPPFQGERGETQRPGVLS